MKRKIVILKITLLTAFIISIIYTALSLPVFKIVDIEITGNEKLTNEYIKSIISNNRGKTLYKFSGAAARRDLLINPYVSGVSFTRIFPGKLSVNITERKVSGYVQYMNGEYIYISEEGTVLEVAPDYPVQLPVVVGLNFTAFSLGQPILPDNSSAFYIIVELQYLFNKYNMEQDIIRVDLSDEDNIHLFIYNIDVEFGGIANADEKIRALKEILKNIPDYETVKGFLNMNSVNKNELARFRRLT